MRSEFSGDSCVADQSLPRGRERQTMAYKLAYVAERGVHGLAYLSRACVVVLWRGTNARIPAIARGPYAYSWRHEVGSCVDGMWRRSLGEGGPG